MANPTVPRAAKICARCRVLFRPKTNYKRAKYCSLPCAHKARTRLSRVLAGRKAGQTKARLRPERMQNAKQAAYRRGYSDGYEQALKDMEATK